MTTAGEALASDLAGYAGALDNYRTALLDAAGVASGLDVPALPAPPFPVHPGAVVGQAQVDKMGPGAAVDKILASGSTTSLTIRPTQRYTSLSYKPWTPGTAITLTPAFKGDTRWGEELVAFHDDMVAAKLQALLAIAGPAIESAARKAIVVQIADAYVTVTSFAKDTAEQRRLVLGWGLTNLCQAIELLGLHDHPIVGFVQRFAFGLDEGGKRWMWWPQGANWLASFVDSTLAAAVVLERRDLFVLEMDRWSQWIASSIRHKEWDGIAIRSLATTSATGTHWRSQIPATLFAPTTMVDGTTAEETRDLGHDMMGLGAWVHGGLTIRHQGFDVPDHGLDRLALAYERKASLYLAHLTGAKTYPYPLGGGSANLGWLPALTLLGDRVPTVAKLAERSEIANPGIGGNHLIAEGVTDGR